MYSNSQLVRLWGKRKKCIMCGREFIPGKTSPNNTECHHCSVKYTPSKSKNVFNVEEDAHKLLDKFNKLDSLEFEMALEHVFKEIGYEVTRTKASGD